MNNIEPIKCPNCSNDSFSLLEHLSSWRNCHLYRCDVCSKTFQITVKEVFKKEGTNNVDIKLAI